jgi:hypothetical protein
MEEVSEPLVDLMKDITVGSEVKWPKTYE